MRVAVVVNSAAGTALDGPAVAALVARLGGLEATLIDEPADDLTGRVRRAIEGGAELLVVGGGDGTIGCAAQLVAGTDVALGIVPMGTMNRLAKDLAIPVEAEAAVAVLAAGHTRRIDVGVVNGHSFLRSSVLGFPARMAVRRESRRGRLGLADYWALGVTFLRELYRYPALPLTLRFADERRRVRTRMLVIANNGFVEAAGEVLAKGRLDRGELALYYAPGLGLRMIARVLLGMLVGRWREAAGLEQRRVKALVVGSGRRRLRVMNDGEPSLMEPPLRYRIRPGALRIVVPEGSTVAAPAPSLAVA